MEPAGYPKLAILDPFQVMEEASRTRANDIVIFTRLIISITDKEKAIELIREARWRSYYQAGKERARVLGYPADLETFIQDYFIETNAMPPFVHRGVILEKTAKTAKIRFPGCFISRAIKVHPEANEETKDVICRGYCQHDQAFSQGFNSKITATNIRNAILDPDNNCDFQVKIKD
jgi:hypothetical protein